MLSASYFPPFRGYASFFFKPFKTTRLFILLTAIYLSFSSTLAFADTPPLKTVLDLRWDDLRSRYFGEFQTRVVGKQDRLSNAAFTASNGGSPGFATSDIRGGYNFRRERYRLSLNTGVTNLFDRFYSEQLVLAPARGRSFVFGTTLGTFLIGKVL